MKELHELVNDREPAWPIVEGWIKEAKCSGEILRIINIKDRPTDRES